MPNALRSNALAAAIVLISLAAYLPFAPVRLYDFRAFYCAGRAVAAHADPYREGSLHACERATSVPGMPIDVDDVTVPAPLPGYALAFFALLSALPFGVCVVVWISASLAAVVLTIELLRRTVPVAGPAIAVVIGLPAAIVAIPLGQPAPFVGAAIALCAYALVTRRPLVAAAAAVATSLDPAIAIVLCATLFVAVPATRIAIVIGTAALVIMALAALGADTNLEYLRAVLHEHAAGNVAERSQFSATHFAWVAGIARGPALTIGSWSFALAAGAGVWASLRLRAAHGPAAYALVPPAFAVFGGLYVHYSQVVLAIPAFLMLAGAGTAERSRLRSSIFVLAVPWLALVAFPPFSFAIVCLAMVYARGRHAWAGLQLGLGSAGALLLFFCVALIAMHAETGAFHSTNAANALIETGWSRYVAWRDPRPSPVFLLLQTPTMLAFTGALVLLVQEAWHAKRLARLVPAR